MWKKHPTCALVIPSGKKTQWIARVFEFINKYNTYITKSLSKIYSKHTSLYAAYFTQTPFPPKNMSSKTCFFLSHSPALFGDMAFGKGQQQPDRKWNASIDQRRWGTQKTQKQAHEQVLQDMEIPRDKNELPRDDKDVDSAKDDEEEDSAEDDDEEELPWTRCIGYHA